MKCLPAAAHDPGFQNRGACAGSLTPLSRRRYTLGFGEGVGMASRPPPRFVVRRHDDAGNRRRRWVLIALWLGSVLMTALITRGLALHVVPAIADHRQQRALATQIDGLKQQLADLQRAAQVNEIATRSLQGTLAQREEEISGLRADLGFYARLVGGDAQQHGLKLQEVKLQPIAGTHGWNLIMSLTQSARRGDEISGSATISVEGLRGNQVIKLDWPALGDTAQQGGIPFHFMYFQRLHATIVLPENFRPTRLRFHIQPTGGEAIHRAVAWGDALSGNITAAQGDKDAQP
jgi:hypothetical protein